ncbi:MAG: T9SS type A sorting domain-containing protein [Candidatus Poribacteria bacterium]|nr:T9SS type A sorting domain-containing protein [Candidatus Poribacteria bacterium]
MHTHIKTNFLFFTFTLFLCLNSFFLINTDAQDSDEPIGISTDYTFETIDIPGVEFLALTASSDFEDYAGYTKSADGEKFVAFTLIDGVFTTYDFPGSQNTYFYALGNNGNAAGHYEDSNGLFHGVVLENGELRQYDFPNSVQTEIYGISDATGALTGNWTDASGVRRGFTDDIIIEFPGTTETYADFVSGGRLVGSYVDAQGTYHAYILTQEGGFTSLSPPNASKLEYFFVHGINDAGTYVHRSKQVNDVPRTYVGTVLWQHEVQSFFALNAECDFIRNLGVHCGQYELWVPDSVSTEGWNVNQDGSIVGHYDSADGRRHGFIARPIKGTDQSVSANYTFESIDVPDIEFLALTASSDFEDYAGYTRSADGEKDVAFTLIDGVFTTYDFPGSQNTYFFALGNNGDAAGYYEDSEGYHRGIVLQDGELRPYDFPNSVQTEIYGISDATGALTGNWTDASGVRRGFTDDIIIEFPDAVETYADFVSGGRFVGSYVDTQGTYRAYVITENRNFTSIALPNASKLEYYFIHGINDAGTYVGRSKLVNDVPRTYVGTLTGRHELKVPGSVSTQGYNINQDGSVVGHYESADGRRHGFIARPVDAAVSTQFSNFYTVTLAKGLNMLSVPLAPSTPMTAKSLVALTGATTIITLDTASQRFIAWTPGAPDEGFPIEGGKGYIVNVPQTRNFAFVGAPWTDPTEAAAAAPIARSNETWAFVVSGKLDGIAQRDGYTVVVRNLRTDSVMTSEVRGTYFAAATADFNYRSVVKVGDRLELTVTDTDGNIASEKFSFTVKPTHLENAMMILSLDSIGIPKRNQLLQNYPNPFNPETWIPYQLAEDTPVSVSIYDITGKLVRTLSLGFQSAGFYNSRERAAYWDGRNKLGEPVASGLYFYTLKAGDFTATRKMLIRK